MIKIIDAIMKWVTQIIVMLSDILIIIGSLFVIYAAYTAKSIAFWILAVIVIWLAYDTWKKQGGFIAWKERKSFMRNWDKHHRGRNISDN